MHFASGALKDYSFQQRWCRCCEFLHLYVLRSGLCMSFSPASGDSPGWYGAEGIELDGIR
jgi:hypothetical protein